MRAPRASNSIIFTDMDDVVLAKTSAAGKSAAPPKTPQGRFKGGASNEKYVNRDGIVKKVFGGTNSRNNKDPAVMARLKGKAVGMYGTAMGSGTWYSGGGPLAWNRFNTDKQPDSQGAATPGRAVARERTAYNRNSKYVNPRDGVQRRVFGGTNSRNSDNPAIMARLKGKGLAMYGKMAGDRPLQQKNR